MNEIIIAAAGLAVELLKIVLAAVDGRYQSSEEAKAALSDAIAESQSKVGILDDILKKHDAEIAAKIAAMP